MKTKLLLHICCAPDEAYAVSLIKNDYDLHCFFSNPNIFPSDEYELRLREAEKAARVYDVPFTRDDYDYGLWTRATQGLTDTPEGGARCRECFFLRLSRTAQFCAQINFDAFATVMSVSPHKNILMLNEAGEKAATLHNVKYISFNFKKNDGFKKSILLSKELGLYRQNYCGCELSEHERSTR